MAGITSRCVQNEQPLIFLCFLNFSKPSPEAESLEKPGAEAPELPASFLGYCSARYIKVTICARLQSVSGLKVVAPVPEVTPSLTAQRTASA